MMFVGWNEQPLVPGENTPETLMLQAERERVIHEALAKLAEVSPRRAEVIRARFFEDATLQQIGDNMECFIQKNKPSGRKGISITRVRDLLSKGLLQLRIILMRDYGVELPGSFVRANKHIEEYFRLARWQSRFDE
jgi:DNA-directed RNA polymerase sigma subunit (sigma70/sigma32)